LPDVARMEWVAHLAYYAAEPETERQVAVRLGLGGVIGEVRHPFHARHVREVGQVLRGREAGDEPRQARAVFVEITARRRMLTRVFMRHRLEEILADDLAHNRVGVAERCG